MRVAARMAVAPYHGHPIPAHHTTDKPPPSSWAPYLSSGEQPRWAVQQHAGSGVNDAPRQRLNHLQRARQRRHWIVTAAAATTRQRLKNDAGKAAQVERALRHVLGRVMRTRRFPILHRAQLP